MKTNVHRSPIQPEADTNWSGSVSLCSLFYSELFDMEFDAFLPGNEVLILQV